MKMERLPSCCVFVATFYWFPSASFRATVTIHIVHTKPNNCSKILFVILKLKEEAEGGGGKET